VASAGKATADMTATDAGATVAERHRARRHCCGSECDRCGDRENFRTHQTSPFSAVTRHTE
jgi:hypothetical protein